MFNIQDGRLVLTKLKRLDLTPSEVDRYRLEVGDLLVNRVNSRELVGKCAVVEAREEPLVFEAMNIRVRLVERRHLPSYFNLVLRTDRIRELFRNSSKQAIGQASINQPQVAGVSIPLPPLDEQRRIVAKVHQLMALVDALETQLATSRATAENLLSAIVAELTNETTFEGVTTLAA
jgi:type I restriction enzyme S subunit